MHHETQVLAVCFALTVGVMAWILRQRLSWFFAATALAGGVAFGHWRATSPRVQARLDDVAGVLEQVPHLLRLDESYVSSDRCQACHPHAYHTWHQSFHRTMTQVALPENVMGEFDGSVINSHGLEYRVTREGDTFWAEMPDPDVMMLAVMNGKPLGNNTFLAKMPSTGKLSRIHLADIPKVKRQVVMTTGSHHYQTYWVESPRFDRLMQTLPLVYLPRDNRWIPREEAFMREPGELRLITQWNHHCIKCHSTGGVPGLNEKGLLDTRVAELGISCEACHGPAGEHIKATEGLIQRYAHRLQDETDLKITNPAKLDHRRSSQVCGQCHGVFIMEEENGLEYARNGILFRPGDDLHEIRYYVQHPKNVDIPEAEEEFNQEFYRQRWWDDGTVLAGGREYTALSVSACFTKGEISCLSCHTMHGDDPNEQMKPGMRTSKACTQCHQERQYTSDISSHTHHQASSSGSDCLNCHMPHTTYALFEALRSHQITKPSIAASIEHGTPNACNLCHLDKTLHWSQTQMAEWYGIQPLPLDEQQREISAALLWLLKGDAAQRVIAAWHFGWEPARAASGTDGRYADDWLAPMVARLLSDPYGVVRYVALDSLRSLHGFADFEFDFLSSEEDRKLSVQLALERWEDQKQLPITRHGTSVLVDRNGELHAAIEQLLLNRNNRPVSIRE